MAIYHLNVGSIKRSQGGKTYSAALKFDYISREGIYAERGGLEYSASENMPAWAHDDPRAFWDAADATARANGRLLTEVEYALPHELNREEQIALARQFADKIAKVEGGKLPYTLALHTGDHANPNDHVHAAFAETINDGLDRDAETWFKRHNSADPAHSGAEKTRELLHKDFVSKARETWADECNRALAQAQVQARVDHRSLKAQGIDRLPEIHVGYRDPNRPEIHAERAARNQEIKAFNPLLDEVKREINREIEAATVDLGQAQAEFQAIQTIKLQLQQAEVIENEHRRITESLERHGAKLSRHLENELGNITSGSRKSIEITGNELSHASIEHSSNQFADNQQLKRGSHELKDGIGDIKDANSSAIEGVSWLKELYGKCVKLYEFGIELIKEFRERRELEKCSQELDGQVRGFEQRLPDIRGKIRDQEFQLNQSSEGITDAKRRVADVSQQLADTGNRLTETSQELDQLIRQREVAKARTTAEIGFGQNPPPHEGLELPPESLGPKKEPYAHEVSHTSWGATLKPQEGRQNQPEPEAVKAVDEQFTLADPQWARENLIAKAQNYVRAEQDLAQTMARVDKMTGVDQLFGKQSVKKLSAARDLAKEVLETTGNETVQRYGKDRVRTAVEASLPGPQAKAVVEAIGIAKELTQTRNQTKTKIRSGPER